MRCFHVTSILYVKLHRDKITNAHSPLFINYQAYLWIGLENQFLDYVHMIYILWNLVLLLTYSKYIFLPQTFSWHILTNIKKTVFICRFCLIYLYKYFKYMINVWQVKWNGSVYELIARGRKRWDSIQIKKRIPPLDEFNTLKIIKVNLWTICQMISIHQLRTKISFTEHFILFVQPCNICFL